MLFLGTGSVALLAFDRGFFFGLPVDIFLIEGLAFFEIARPLGFDFLSKVGTESALFSFFVLNTSSGFLDEPFSSLLQNFILHGLKVTSL